MGLLDDALNMQDSKRSARLAQVSRAAKINANKIKEGTYRGISRIDGTALIQLDGQDTVTSGYRLITNAPLGNGDRVSIRPNGVGSPRADARNVPTISDQIVFTANLLATFVFDDSSFNQVRSQKAVSKPFNIGVASPVLQQSLFRWASLLIESTFPPFDISFAFGQDNEGDLQFIVGASPFSPTTITAVLSFSFQVPSNLNASRIKWSYTVDGAGTTFFEFEKRLTNNTQIQISLNLGDNINRNERILDLLFTIL
jgi:hypothetical protein